MAYDEVLEPEDNDDEGAGDNLLDLAEEAVEKAAAPADPRDQELVNDKKVRAQLDDKYQAVKVGFDDQKERTDTILDYWDMYNCKLGSKQAYAGNNQLFVPLIHDAIRARVTRFVNQMFPRSERTVDAVSSDGSSPQGLCALLEHYIRKAMLRTQVMPALMACGDIEGQYTVYVDWSKMVRWVTTRSERPMPLEGTDLGDPDEDEGVLTEEEVIDSFPKVEVISDADFCVVPATVDSIDEALSCGGSATRILRWSKAKIERMLDEEEIDKEAAEALLAQMGSEDEQMQRESVGRAQTDAAGIHRSGGEIEFACIYETWTVLKLEEGHRLCRVWFGGDDNFLSVKRNPYWSDLLPIVSVPVEKVHGSFKGKPKVGPCADFQIAANDAINEGMDSAAFALMPIIMTDPEKNPRVGSMILSLAAIWETSPNDTQFAQFPQMWKDAFEIVNNAKQQVFQTLSINPAQITQGNPYRKPTQAEIAAEQQVDVLTTADAVTTVEGGILTPIITRMVAMDQQFRDKETTVQAYGEMGVRADMEVIPPLAFDKHWQFRWFGVEAARSAQQIQQQISAINVVRTIPPALYQGWRLDLAPAITHLMEAAFGPYLAPQVWKNMRSSLSQEPEAENEIMATGLDMPVHPLDDHEKHLAAHIKALMAEHQEKGPNADPSGALRVHILQHQQMMAQQQQQAVQQMMGPGGGAPGQEQASGPPSGSPGQPRPGAQVGSPRSQGPAGMIHQDRMQDAAVMPRTQGAPGIVS